MNGYIIKKEKFVKKINIFFTIIGSIPKNSSRPACGRTADKNIKTK